MPNQTEGNRAVVREFYDLAFNRKKPREAAKHIGATYRQHNPTAPDGSEAFIEFVTVWTRQVPQLRVDLKRLIAEGDLVVVHSHFTMKPGDPGTAVMDIFRLEGGKIVEHWDVMQPVNEKPANSNTMF